jgi:hypothetical protein
MRIHGNAWREISGYIKDEMIRNDTTNTKQSEMIDVINLKNDLETNKIIRTIFISYHK